MTKLGKRTIQAAIGVIALTIATLRAGAEPNKLSAGLLGEWCQIGGSGVHIDQTGKITSNPAHWIYRRGRCSNPHYRLTVRSNGMTDGGQPCRLVDIFEEPKALMASFECSCSHKSTCTASHWLALTPGGTLHKLVIQTKP